MTAQRPLPGPDPDADLVRRAQTGDYDAFTTLVKRHESRLWRVTRRLTGQDEDAREALQNTFLAVIEHIDSFRGDSRFSTWMVTIASREALRVARKRLARHSRQDDTHDVDESIADIAPRNVSPWHRSPEELLRRRETADLIERALDSIDPKYRQVFVLRDVEEMSIDETAAATGLTPANVKVRLMRARLMLRDKLAPLFDDAARDQRGGMEDDHG